MTSEFSNMSNGANMASGDTIKIQRIQGDRDVPVVELGQTDTPKGDGGYYASEITQGGWDGHTRDTVANHLVTWTLPATVRKVQQEVEDAVEEGIPDQRRRMVRNQAVGQLEDRYVTQIAIGETVERPFKRWSRSKRGEVRVAICLDATSCSAHNAELIRARMAVCAGLASALDGADYDVAVVAASLTVPSRKGSKPRRSTGSFVGKVVLKDEGDPMVGSGFAHFADTGLRRLVWCWLREDNGYTTHLSDSEWRQLTDEPDLLVYVGAGGPAGQKAARSGWSFKADDVINSAGRPSGMAIGPVGEDVLRLNVSRESDTDQAIEDIRTFFENLGA